jgi:hypothetical protein
MNLSRLSVLFGCIIGVGLSDEYFVTILGAIKAFNFGRLT